MTVLTYETMSIIIDNERGEYNVGRTEADPGLERHGEGPGGFGDKE